MQSMVMDLLEKEKEALISNKPIAGMSIGITELVMEGVHLDHEQLHLTLLEKRESDPNSSPPHAPPFHQLMWNTQKSDIYHCPAICQNQHSTPYMWGKHTTYWLRSGSSSSPKATTFTSSIQSFMVKLNKLDAIHWYNLVCWHLITLGLLPLNSDLHELTVAHMTAKNAAQSHGIGDSMRPNAWLWGALKPEGLDSSAEEE
ncbi:hypothetical protein EDD18DRAFT_1100700 [Armillaria luteobubalina]|uniref:Uncharacterized protein n=1 Tax=Armillaria luteobubalina TaxID=153913 RepID=A0AA39QFZ4_9AGAR|nr:hypothetical protein EDD18DRAFT_1100700 [Armillaria luteobubalina]